MRNALPKAVGGRIMPFSQPAPFILSIFSFIVFVFLALGTLRTQAQEFPGYSTGNYTGVNGVFSNPANIADSKYRWDVNLFSFSMLVGNNNASFSLKDIGSTFNGDSLRNKLTGKGAALTSGMLNMDIHGPSFMFNLGKKNAVAFTSRARVMVNIKNIDGHLADQFMNTDASTTLPYTFSTASDNVINVNAWTEFGASFARVLMEDGPNYFKGGITLKYLAGFANGYLRLNNVNGTLAQDFTGTYLSQTTGQVGLGFGGTRIDDIKSGKAGSFNSSGFGADIGFVYELKPTPHQYKLKIGVALLDIGSISYKRDTSRSGSYTASITGGEKAYVDDFGKVDDYKQYFEAHPQFFTPAPTNGKTSYSASLPTTLQLEVDYHLLKKFYLNMSGQFSLATTTDAKPYNSSYYSGWSLTPRYEGRRFGFYLPVSYNGLTHFNAGYCIRFGPVFAGSGSALTALFNNSKQFDTFFGVRFGGLRK
jgi:hypothetical protein